MRDSSKSKTQKVLKKNENGEVVKTFDGYVYREFDSLGRMTLIYGNFKTPEQPSNFKNVIFYKKDTVEVWQYVFEDNNPKYKITNDLDCHISKYVYEKGKLKKALQYNRVYANDKITGHEIVEINEDVTFNPFEKSLKHYKVVD